MAQEVLEASDADWLTTQLKLKVMRLLPYIAPD